MQGKIHLLAAAIEDVDMRLRDAEAKQKMKCYADNRANA